MLDHVTPLVFTFNEEDNLERCLAKLDWAREILVIDSNSSDRTLEICAAHPRVRTIQHAFTDHATQWTFGTAQVTTPWALAMDADWIMSDELITELGAIHPDSETAGFEIGFELAIQGAPLRSAIYPPRIALYRPEKSRYWMEGHAIRVAVEGPVKRLSGTIRHDDRKPLARWFSNTIGYASRDVDRLLDPEKQTGRWIDRLRGLGWLVPFLVFFHVLFVRGCIFNGRRGLFYAMQRVTHEAMVATELLNRRTRNQK